MSDQLQGGSFPGLPGPLASHHFLLKTASGFFPPNQSLPLFTPAPQNWDFFGPGSSFLLRSGKKGCEGGGRQAAEACPPWVICGSPVLGKGSGSYMCLLHICARSSFPVSIDICPQWERSPKGFVLRPRGEGDKWNLQ